MNAPKLPPHPLNFRCDGCMFWNRAMVQDVYMMPNGQAIPVKAQVAPGQIPLGTPKMTVGVCQLFPKWEHMTADQYCWNHKAAGPSTRSANNDER